MPGAKVMFDVSTEFCPVAITHEVAGAAVDPRTDFPSCKMTWTADKDTKPPGDKNDVAWKAATWETAGNRYYLIALVGPNNSGTVLAAGKHAVWVYLDGPLEEPILYAGTLTIK